MKLNRGQKKEVKDLSRFIDAHGGRLGAFRGYRITVPPKSGDSGTADETTPPKASGSVSEARAPEAGG